MNWKQLNEAYPQSFLEWVKQERKSNVISIQWKHQEDDYFNGSYANFNGETGLMTCFDDIDLRALPEYFDTLGIIIIPEYHIAEKMFTCLVINNKTNEKLYIGFGYETRAEVIEIAVEYAFRIREKQLTQ